MLVRFQSATPVEVLMKTILVFGLPGSGKTTFAKKLKELLGDRAIHFNGDEFRKTYNDWDFSEEGRFRQAERMRNAALNAHQEGKYAILDFVCPKQEYRDLIDPDFSVYMKCAPVRNFEDTTAMFEKPQRLFVWDIESYEEADQGVIDLYNVLMDCEFNPTAPTALMIGRYQPFHDGHKALFVKALEKHGQVCIAIRDMPQSANNPYTPGMVEANIHKSLQEYRGKYEIVVLPNIVDVVYGRDVGWTVSKIDLPPEIEAISATKIREGL
jgi:adenylylsulfate kinase